MSSLSSAFTFENCTGLKYVTLEDGVGSLSFNNINWFQNCPIETFHWGRNIIDANYFQPSPVYGK